MDRSLAVSVVIPVLDHPDGLAATLRSLDAQTFPPSDYEVIVVDNGSGEDALRVVEQSCTSRSNVRLLIERAIRSSYAARNRGIDGASGVAIAFTDADCRPGPHWLWPSACATWASFSTIRSEGRFAAGCGRF